MKTAGKTKRISIDELMKMHERIAELESTEIERKSAEKALGKARGELQTQVKERTAELEKENRKLKKKIAELENIENVLRDSEERFKSFLEEMNDGYCVIQDSTIAFANSRIAEMFDYTQEEVVGKTIQDFLPGEIIEGLVDVHARRKRGELVPPQYETVLQSKDGRTLPVEFGARLIQYQGRPAASVVIRDITARRQAEERLARTMLDLARSNGELEQFAYVASHDLQEPLRMVTSFVQLLARRYQGKLDEEADEFIAFAVDGANRMQSLINDLLAFSRVGTRGRDFEPTDCEVILQRTLANLRLAIEDAGAVVTHDTLPTVMADGEQLGQVFQNFISNAIKFRSKEQPQVHISAKKEGKEWVFSFKDNGIGIAPEFDERIFLIFQRLHTRAEYPGTGIGLAICKRIVERHGGRIWIESGSGKGSTFLFTIPSTGGKVS